MLVVAPAHETQEVLRWAFESRGISVETASAAAQALRRARQWRPDLIVFDDEACSVDLSVPPDQLALAAGSADTPLVILGTLRQPATEGRDATFLRKPYQYAALIHKIEELLEIASAVPGRPTRLAG